MIPIYVNLSGFAAQPVRVPLRDYVLKQLGKDEELLRAFNETWRDTKLNVLWVFLFDDVDRVLARWPLDHETYFWPDELAEFLGVNGRHSRAVIAGKRMPNIAGAISLDIAPIHEHARNDFLHARGVALAQRDALTMGKSFRQYSDNIGWLNFISSYLAAHTDEEPDGFYTLMRNCVEQKISSAKFKDTRVSEELVHGVAEEAAIRLCGHKGPGGPIVRSELMQSLCQNETYPAEITNFALNELVRIGLMTIYLDADDRECLAFTHDSIQSHFAISRLLQVEARSLEHSRILTDSRWRTVAISLLQHGSKPLVSELVVAAKGILGSFGEAPSTTRETIIDRFLRSADIPERDSWREDETPPSSPMLAYLVLHVLDAGFQRKPLLISDALSDEVDRFVAQVFSRCTWEEKAQIIDIQHLAHSDVAAAMCAVGLRSASGRLVCQAVTQMTARCQLVDLLALRDRMRFVLAVSLVGLDRWISEHVNPAYRDRLRFASYTGIVAAWLFIAAFALGGIANVATHPHKWRGDIVEVAIATLFALIVFTSRRYSRVSTRVLKSGVKYPFGVAVVLAGLGFIELIGIVARSFEGNIPIFPELLSVSAFLWPMSTLYYLAIESNPSASRWTFPFKAIFLPAWRLLWTRKSGTIAAPSKRQVVSAALFIIAGADALVLPTITVKGWHLSGLDLQSHRELYASLKWLAWLVLALCIVALPVTDSMHDVRLLRRWRPPMVTSSQDVLEWLDEARTSWGAVRMMSVVERRLPMVTAQGTLESLTDIWRVLEAVNAVGPSMGPALTADVLAIIPRLLTPGLEEWLKTYDAKHPGRLWKIARRHQGPLSTYIGAVGQTVNHGIQSPRFMSQTQGKHSGGC